MAGSNKAVVSLTEKQVEVLERLERRLTLAEIAHDLGVSESAINQRIRLLKHRFGVNTLRELVACYRAHPVAVCRDSTARIPQLPRSPGSPDPVQRDDRNPVFRFADSIAVPQEAPWNGPEEPTVVPGMLDGSHAGRVRLAVIVAIALGVLVAVILAVAAATAVTDVLDGGRRPATTSMPSAGPDAPGEARI